jgi:beta-glucanase (GH16 family)
MLVTERRHITFRYGYFEIRTRFPEPGRGMFPAIWLYVADGRTVPDPRKSGAEIDILEILGEAEGHPWDSTAHLRDWQGTGQQVGVVHSDADTRGWHVYGLEWRQDRLRFFLNGQLTGELAGPDAAWFDVPMSIRLNFAVDGSYVAKRGRASNTSTPSSMTMQVDYVRVFE